MVIKKVDLHSHTTFSDGNLTPEELVSLAKQKGLDTIALTDHDTVDGVKVAMQYGKKINIEVIPGVEISAKNDKGHTHILGYFIDITDQVFLDHLTNYIDSRNRRNPKIIKQLNKMGVPLSMDDVYDVAKGNVINRPHIAQALVNKGFADSKIDAFDRYLDKSAPAYVPKDVYSAEEAISIIHQAGGLAVLAHPQQLGENNKADTLSEIQKLVDYGLDGIEAYHGECVAEWCHEFATYADNAGLLITGGSDFHGDEKHCDLGQIGGGLSYLSYDFVEKMRERLCVNQ